MSAEKISIKCGLIFLSLISCDGNSPTAPTGSGDFLIKNGDITIAGTLDLPSTSGPHPVMVIVPGSGTETRESDISAVDLAIPLGIAVFRYDKRGLGQSTGTFQNVGRDNSADLVPERASDVLAIVNFLTTHQDVNPDQIFLFGTSQGGWVVPLVAIQSENVAFIVCGSGGGSSVGISDYYDGLADNAALSIAELTAMLETYTGPQGYDPGPALQALRVPAFWFYGGMDRSNPTLYDISALEAVKQEHDKDFTICTFPFANHDLDDVRTGEPEGDLVPKLIAWMDGQLGR